MVATVHTHAAYDKNYGTNNDNFSLGDKENAKKRGVPNYLAAPRGILRKYDPFSEKNTLIYIDLPFDSKHPDRRK